MSDVWIGCLRIPDVPAWALHHSDAATDPFLAVENGRVAGVSRTPRRRGVRPGMTTLRGTSLCGEATVHPRDRRLEEGAWERVLDDVNALTPRIETERPGRAWFEPRSGSELRTWLDGTPFHGGVARSRSVALLAAWKAAEGRFLCIRRDHQSRFLSRTPVRALADVGFSEDLTERLRLFGYSSVEAARSLSKRPLDAQFGAEGRRLHAFLHPEPDRVSFYDPPPRITFEHVFEREVDEPGPMQAVLKEGARDLARRLEGTTCQRLILRLEGREAERRASRVLREPTGDSGPLRRVASLLLDEALEPGLTVAALHLTAGALHPARSRQGHLFFRRPSLRRAIAAVQQKHPGALYRVQTDPDAVFEDQRFEYEPVALDS